MWICWTFRCYLTERGTDVIDEWYREQSEALQAKFDTRLRYLRQHPRSDWVRPYFDTLRKKCAGLGEIRFAWNKVQYRPWFRVRRDGIYPGFCSAGAWQAVCAANDMPSFTDPESRSDSQQETRSCLRI